MPSIGLSGIKEAYLRNYGNQYFCLARDAENLARQYERLCDRLGLAYTFGQINRQMLAHQPRQLSLLEGPLSVAFLSPAGL